MKKLFDSIPLSRIILYFVILGLLPFVYVVYHFTSEKDSLLQLENKIENVRQLALEKEQKQALNQVVRKHYMNADPLYLEKNLESLALLKKEKLAIEQLMQSRHFTGNEAAESRYKFLTGEGNRLHFTGGSVQTSEGIQESIEMLSHPIEVDGEDLKEILARIESKRTQQPQLIISDFKLSRKTLANESEVFEMQMKLLKREFLSS